MAKKLSFSKIKASISQKLNSSTIEKEIAERWALAPVFILKPNVLAKSMAELAKEMKALPEEWKNFQQFTKDLEGIQENKQIIPITTAIVKRARQMKDIADDQEFAQLYLDFVMLMTQLTRGGGIDQITVDELKGLAKLDWASAKVLVKGFEQHKPIEPPLPTINTAFWEEKARKAAGVSQSQFNLQQTGDIVFDALNPIIPQNPPPPVLPQNPTQPGSSNTQSQADQPEVVMVEDENKPNSNEQMFDLLFKQQATLAQGLMDLQKGTNSSNPKTGEGGAEGRLGIVDEKQRNLLYETITRMEEDREYLESVFSSSRLGRVEKERAISKIRDLTQSKRTYLFLKDQTNSLEASVVLDKQIKTVENEIRTLLSVYVHNMDEGEARVCAGGEEIDRVFGGVDVGKHLDKSMKMQKVLFQSKKRKAVDQPGGGAGGPGGGSAGGFRKEAPLTSRPISGRVAMALVMSVGPQNI